MIGQIQWCVALGRIDIFSACVTMSSFRAAPRINHLERLKRIYGYLLDTKNGALTLGTAMPDFSKFHDQMHDWARSIYGNVTAEIPDDIPTPKGNPVVLTHYVDANLYHDMATRRALTGILHLINQFPFYWYCKKQATVETATFGSEFNAAKSAVEQIINIRNTLRYLGVPIQGRSMMFGDNQSVVTNATIPHSQLNKRHLALAYHKVREAIASNMLNFYHIEGTNNPADIMSKLWGYQQVASHLRALLFWHGDTLNIPQSIEVDTHVQSRGEYYHSTTNDKDKDILIWF